jgi:hypothetical protein
MVTNDGGTHVGWKPSLREVARPLTAIFTLFFVIAFCHSLFLRYDKQRRRELRFPPLAPDAAPIPPVAFIEDLYALSDFFWTSVDDVAEDVSKLGCVAASYSVGFAVVGSHHYATARGVGLGVALTTYTGCDHVADYVGDITSEALARVAHAFG